MKSKILLFILITIFLIIFIIFFRGLQNPNIYIPQISKNQNIPFFKAQIFDSKDQTNSKEIFENNKLYLLNIWASWCIPCREEHSFLIDLMSLKNLEIIGLNYKDNDQNAKTFLEELVNPYKLILSDNNGTIAIEWGAYGVPETFLIYNKKIIKKFIGPLNNNSLTEIKDLLNEMF